MMKIVLPTGMPAWMFQLTYGSLNWKPVSSTNGNHGRSAGYRLITIGVLDTSCSVLHEGLSTA